MTEPEKKIRTPADVAEYDQMKADAYGEIDRLRAEARQAAEDGHDELCLVAFFYTRTMAVVHSMADIEQVVRLLTFALIQGADLPNKDQIGCVK